MKNVIHVKLTEPMKRAAKVRAAERGVSVSEYVSRLIQADGEKEGRDVQQR
jgi:predicted HicB family RNase H-like nuclease